MGRNKEKDLHTTSANLDENLPDGADVYSLEDILLEFGNGQTLEEKLTAPAEPAELPISPPVAQPIAPHRVGLRLLHKKTADSPVEAVPPEDETAPPEVETVPTEVEAADNPVETAPPETVPAERETADEGGISIEELLLEDLPHAPRPISMEEVVGRTVDSVLAEGEELLPPRRFLFSRRPMPDTEQMYDTPKPPPPPEPEPPLSDSMDDWRRLRAKWRRPLPFTAFLTLLLLIPPLLEERGITIPYWTGDLLLQSGVLLVGLLLACLLAGRVFVRAWQGLLRKRCTPELLIVLSAAVAAADCIARPFLEGRCPAVPLAAVSCGALTFALWGGLQEAKGMYDSFRLAALDDEPPYYATDAKDGVCKRVGRVEGFTRISWCDSTFARQQAILLPVILVATVVFALLASVGNQKPQNFLWCWSAILTAASAFALPISYSLPFAKLAHRLQKSGATVAGYAGAERLGRKKTIIVTDSDLFPPGAVTLKGIKTFGEENRKVISYAASLTRASGNGLVRLFDGLLRSEGCFLETVDDFSFYEEGGVSGTIHGEAVVLGTASFMRKMEVRIPGNLTLRTGVFLAIDRQLAAVFAVKYMASENVEWALRTLRRAHITSVLAVRDGNINQALLGRKFRTKARVTYPPLASRLALSAQEKDEGRPDALLLREGLMPYAELVAGSRRYAKAARRSNFLALLGSVCGALLAFYLTFSGAYVTLTPSLLLLFLLLWTLPALLLAGLVNHI
ncbi:MAG: hypothetical protein RRY95_07500 [Oscillospiraceae bacterium]